ncbi:SCO family protein [Rufibacter immobilis]|uniref:SCO family protein n=1 Tax=Rufibacter immobilis TaxID=1348778 RepID=UPI00160B5714|nr:SCO family protein [Rufibacter immobilis]
MNKFSLRTYFPATVDSTMVDGQWRYDTVYHKVPDFQLTSLKNPSFSQKDLQGKIYIASFSDSSCQNTCKQVNIQLGRVQDAFRLQPDVYILSFLASSDADNVSFLKQYAKGTRANPAKWFFLTGSSAQILQIAEQDYLLSSKESALPNASAPLNSGRLILVDQLKQVRGIYDGTDAADVDRMITEINVLLSESTIPNGK